MEWECVKHEMVSEKGLDESVADKIGEYVQLKGMKYFLFSMLSLWSVNL